MNLLSNALIATLKSALSKYSTSRIEDLGISKRMSYAKVMDSIGFAYCPDTEPPEIIELEGLMVRDLFKLAWKGIAETSLALSALSALTQKWIEEGGEVETPSPKVSEMIGLQRGMKVIAIGYMKNVIEELKKEGAQVVLYEDNHVYRCEAKRSGIESYPGNYVFLEDDADAIIATGSSLLDPRLSIVFEKVKSRAKLLIGPTATVHPYFASLLGATHVAGTYVPPENRGKVLTMLKLGYGYKRLIESGLVKKWFVKV
ncbi:hypothetical protein EYM_05095 [Ignicoccus islandicus DSM 13165]|uniref:Putative heavy-metal chelation domain-containing protein n=1 Tax=Ignicoccus islandicus DSM 13165 TaxID=940295 RepID=A0A0U3FA55_9CREN|nr:DUF364 domain-containing protein [Ignicoccus islandicus]ALU12553.1 hypothetical protein EYM_05095 [Ignicoccus islandicus DSM 13165]